MLNNKQMIYWENLLWVSRELPKLVHLQENYSNSRLPAYISICLAFPEKRFLFMIKVFFLLLGASLFCSSFLLLNIKAIMPENTFSFLLWLDNDKHLSLIGVWEIKPLRQGLIFFLFTTFIRMLRNDNR